MTTPPNGPPRRPNQPTPATGPTERLPAAPQRSARPASGRTELMPTIPPKPATPGGPPAQPPSKPPSTPPSTPPRQRRPSGPRQRRWLRRLGIGLVVALLVSCVGLFALQQVVAGRVVVADTRANRPSGKLLNSPSNILLLGVDLRPDHPEEGVRSDTVQLLHLDPGGGWANLLAIPRDSLANVPGLGEAKINRAFAQGYSSAPTGQPLADGMALAADTVEQFLQLPQLGQRIDYVATINFDGFAALVDALGGVEVDVPYRIVDPDYPTPDFGTRVLIIEAGPHHMDGPRALEYVRTRHADSDFGRGQRQQQVLQAMSAALRAKPAPLRIFAGLRVVNAASGAIQTTLPVGRLDALLLGLSLSSFNPAALNSAAPVAGDRGRQRGGVGPALGCGGRPGAGRAAPNAAGRKPGAGPAPGAQWHRGLGAGRAAHR